MSSLFRLLFCYALMNQDVEYDDKKNYLKEEVVMFVDDISLIAEDIKS